MTETFEEYARRLLSLSAGEDPRAILVATPLKIGALIAPFPARDLQQSPGERRWSIAQIVAHLADAELVFAYRVRRILAAPGSSIEPFNQNDWASSQRSEAADAHGSLALFTALRTSMLQLTATLTDAELDSYGVHAERGPESVRYLMSLMAGHDRNHLAQIERLVPERPAFTPAPVKSVVDHDALDRLDIRVGTMRAAVEVAGTDRLAALTVDFGDHTRSIVAGIRTERPTLATVVGLQALFVVNLAPRKIKGHTSEGMLFDAGYADSLRPVFLQPEWPVPPGVRAG
ncbi:MAG TPA: DinB family protein [Vicinamibacterales bacterium]